MTIVRRVPSGDLRSDEVDALRVLFEAAWPHEDDRFTDEERDHTFGGVHFVVEESGRIVSHASVIERELRTGPHRLATGYVEGVATYPSYQRRGLGTSVIQEADAYIDSTFQLGALGTDLHVFYERLGWIAWKGATAVRTDTGLVPTPEEDGLVLVRTTSTSPDLDFSATISCEWQPGDVW